MAIDVCETNLIQKVGRVKAKDILNEFDEFVKKNNIKGGDELLEKMGIVLDEQVRKIAMSQQEKMFTIAKIEQLKATVLAPIKDINDRAGVKKAYNKSKENFRNTLQAVADIKASTRDGFHSIISTVTTRENKKLFTDLTFQKNLLKYLSTDEFDNPTVKEIGDAFKKGFNFLLQSKRAAGIQIDSLKGYAGRQYHNAVKIKEDTQGWVDFAQRNFDFDKMGIEGDRIEKFLENMHTDLTTKNGYVADELAEIQFGSIKKYTEHRAIKFKTVDAEFDYMTQYGSGNYVQSIIRTVEQDAAIVGLGSTFGPRHEVSFTGMLQELNKISDGDFKTSEEEFKKTHKFLQGVGGFGSPKTTAGKIANTVRQFGDFKLSTLSLLSTITDTPFSAAIAETLIGGGAKGYARNLLKFTSSQFKNFTNKDEALKFAKRLSVYAEDMNDLLDSSTLKEGVIESSRGFKKMDNAHRFFMNLTGLPRQNWASKGANSRIISSGLADFSDSSFDQLKPAMQEMFTLHGIKSSDWDVIRSSALETIDGEKYLSPIKLYESNMHDQGLRLAGILRGAAELQSPTASARLNALKASFDPDSATGMLLRSAMQFKSFSISVMRTTEFVAKNSENPIANIAATATIATALGGMVLQAKNYIRTGETKEFDMEFALKAMGQGGTGGLLFDMLSTDYSSSYRSLSGDITGPSVGMAQDLLEMAGRARKGQDISEQAKRAFWFNTPSLLYAPATFKHFDNFMKEL
jgi:hypothetical protein